MSDITRRQAMTTAAAGLVLLAGEPTRGDDDMPNDRWRAWAITEGEATKLTVEGIYANGGPGRVVTLTPTNPQGFNPKILMLDVTVGTLPGIWAAVIQPIPACFTLAPCKPGLYTAIHLNYPDGTAIMIDKITDAGEGPK